MVQIPSLQVFIQGQGAVSADNLDTFLQACDTAARLSKFVGLPGMQVQLLGTVTPGDGGQGIFYWANGVFTNDGVNVIVPFGVTTGAWLRLSNQGGGFPISPLVNVSGTTIKGTDFFIPINNTTGAPFSIMLPLAPNNGESHIFKDWAGNAGTFPITISGNGFNIDANPNYLLFQNFQSVALTFAFGKWAIW